MHVSEQRASVSPVEAADLLNVTHETIRSYWRRGLIEGYRTSPAKGAHLKLYRDSIEEFDRKRRSQPLPDKIS